MSILQMSVTAGILMLTVIIIRAVGLNKLPKNLFLILWGVVLLRLLVPFSVPSQYGIYTAIDKAYNLIVANIAEPAAETVLPENNPVPKAADIIDPAEATDMQTVIKPIEAVKLTELGEQPLLPADKKGLNTSPAIIFWIGGMIAVFACLVIIYIKNCRLLRFALPIRDNEYLNKWLAEHKLMRTISVMQLDRIGTPITVGLIKPRIIFPKSMNMDDEQLLQYVLTHEYYHIRRFDMLWKMLLSTVLCIHWFNPLVWVMFMLANRDLEITCDEMVIRRFGSKAKAAYAYSLISLAEQRRNVILLYNSFSKNAAEERISAIMKYKKSSIIAVVTAVVLTIGATTVFAANASVDTKSNEDLLNTQNSDVTDDEETPIIQSENPVENETVNDMDDGSWIDWNGGMYNTINQYYYQDGYIFQISFQKLDSTKDYTDKINVDYKGASCILAYADAVSSYYDNQLLRETLLKKSRELIDSPNINTQLYPVFVLTDIKGPFDETPDELLKSFYEQKEIVYFSAIAPYAGEKTVEDILFTTLNDHRIEYFSCLLYDGLPQDTADKLFEQAVEKNNIAFVSVLAPFVNQQKKQELAETAFQKSNIALFSLLVPELSQQKRQELAETAFQKSNIALFSLLVPELSQQKRQELAETAFQKSNIALFSLLKSELSQQRKQELAETAFQKSNIALFSLLEPDLSQQKREELKGIAKKNGNILLQGILTNN